MFIMKPKKIGKDEKVESKYARGEKRPGVQCNPPISASISDRGHIQEKKGGEGERSDAYDVDLFFGAVPT